MKSIRKPTTAPRLAPASLLAHTTGAGVIAPQLPVVIRAIIIQGMPQG